MSLGPNQAETGAVRASGTREDLMRTSVPKLALVVDNDRVHSRPSKTQSHDDLMELEFSDYGRDPRFQSGWWILPGLTVVGFIALVTFIFLI